MSLINFIISITIISVLLFTGCGVTYNYHCIDFDDKNPTKYIFNKNIDEIRETILNDENEIKLSLIYNNQLHYVEERYEKNWNFYFKSPKEYLDMWNPYQNSIKTIKTNSLDFYLISYGITKSSELCFDDKNIPLCYMVSFQIHFEIIDSLNTQIEIFTIYPRVITGIEGFPTGFHMSRQFIERSIMPSSIEEYEILLKIGEILGVKEEMPKCKYPIVPGKMDAVNQRMEDINEYYNKVQELRAEYQKKHPDDKERRQEDKKSPADK
jgi:hypothetical protein